MLPRLNLRFLFNIALCGSRPCEEEEGWGIRDGLKVEREALGGPSRS